MAKKKTAKKKKVKKRTSKKTSTKKISLETGIEKTLIENFVALQKVMTTMLIKFDKLTNQLSELLEIFEKSAEALSKKDFKIEQTNNDTKKIVEGIKDLSEQNKIIARGLTMLHESSTEPYLEEQYQTGIVQQEPPFNEPRPLLNKSSNRQIPRNNLIPSRLVKIKPLPKE
jgi:hypothetical protein